MLTHLASARDLSELPGPGTLLCHFEELQDIKQSGRASLRPGHWVTRNKVNRIDFLDRLSGSLFILPVMGY